MKFAIHPVPGTVQSTFPLLRKQVEQAWRLRWWSLLSCAAARAFACSLVDLRVPGRRWEPPFGL